MIVVDANVIAHLTIKGEFSPLAEAAFAADCAWASPLLWLSEYRNTLTKYTQHRSMTMESALLSLRSAEEAIGGRAYQCVVGKGSGIGPRLRLHRLRLRVRCAGAGTGCAIGDDGQTGFARVSENRRVAGKICEEKMSRKLNITVMLGGPSAEREVSLRTGAAVAKALRSLGHEVFELDPKTPDWILPPKTDVVFLALHGTYGEDGTVQKQLDFLSVPYTGCDAEASRIAFDKVLTKQKLHRKPGVPTARFVTVNSRGGRRCRKNFSLPLVVKPARQGSSVGLQFVERAAGLAA